MTDIHLESVPAAESRGRRRFIKLAAGAAVGATAASALVAPDAQADTTPSTTGNNTFTGQQEYDNSSNSPAITIDVQDPAKNPITGGGGGLFVSDFGTKQPGILVDKRAVPTAASPALRLRNLSGTPGSLITIGDGNATPVPNLSIDDAGSLRWSTQGNPSDLALGRSRSGNLHIDGGFEIAAPAGLQGAAATITTPGNGIALSHDHDLQGRTFDLIDLFHKSCGDAIFVAHQGGEPPGFTGIAGGDAAFNCLIPQNIDGTATGRDGSTPNTHKGMKGLFVQAQPNSDRVYAVYLQNWSNEAAITIDNQNPMYSQGSGGGISIIDSGSGKPTVAISKQVTPTSASPLLRLTNLSGTPGSLITIGDGNATPVPNLSIDDRGAIRWAAAGNPSDLAIYRVGISVLRIDGVVELSSTGGYVPALGFGAPAPNTLSFHTGGFERIRVTPAGGIAIGGITPFGSRLLQIGERVSGTSNSLSLQNYHQADGDSVQIEMVDGNRQFAALQGIFTTSKNSGALSLQVRDSTSNSLQERLRMDGTGIGFFATTPAPQPTVSGSRGGNAALTSLISALRGLGLVKDSTNS